MMMSGDFLNGSYDNIMNYRADIKPEWFTAERYEYCEPGSYSSHQPRKSIFSKIKNLIK